MVNSKKEKTYGVFATVPALILFLIFTYIPLLMTLGYSVTDWNGFSKNFNFVGLDNFLQVFKDTEVLQTFGNTLYFTVLVVVIGIVLQLMLAIFLFEKLKGRNVLRAIIYAPCIISPVIVSLTWVNFFQYAGIINEVLSKVGLEGLRVDWLGIDFHQYLAVGRIRHDYLHDRLKQYFPGCIRGWYVRWCLWI